MSYIVSFLIFFFVHLPEIKDVKKRKEKARELEGIDLSNIVSSSRRRSVTSFVPPPKPKIPDVSESESEESEEEEDEEDEEVEDEDVDEDKENGGNGSQSEESEEGMLFSFKYLVGDDF